MIYFDRATQQQVLDNVLNCVEPGGWLLLGHAESLTGLQHDCHYVQPATYRKAARSRLVPAGA
jgi:chemotaxis protein methyltransferase CheR